MITFEYQNYVEWFSVAPGGSPVPCSKPVTSSNRGINRAHISGKVVSLPAPQKQRPGYAGTGLIWMDSSNRASGDNAVNTEMTRLLHHPDTLIESGRGKHTVRGTAYLVRLYNVPSYSFIGMEEDLRLVAQSYTSGGFDIVETLRFNDGTGIYTLYIYGEEADLTLLMMAIPTITNGLST
jgi:hypothetical protein